MRTKRIDLALLQAQPTFFYRYEPAPPVTTVPWIIPFNYPVTGVDSSGRCLGCGEYVSTTGGCTKCQQIPRWTVTGSGTWI